MAVWRGWFKNWLVFCCHKPQERVHWDDRAEEKCTQLSNWTLEKKHPEQTELISSCQYGGCDFINGIWDYKNLKILVSMIADLCKALCEGKGDGREGSWGKVIHIILFIHFLVFFSYLFCSLFITVSFYLLLFNTACFKPGNRDGKVFQ